MQYHLVIADDENVIRKGLSGYIPWNEIDCIMDGTAGNGVEAAELIKKYNPDIVITDIKMPRMDGLELAKYIQENYPKTKVIILTGYAEFEYARSAINYGVVEYLLKPISKDILMESVRRIITGNTREKNIKQSQLQDAAYLRMQILQELACNKQNTEKLLSRAEEYGISLENYHTVVFDIGQEREMNLNYIMENLLKQYPEDYFFILNNCLFWLNRIEDKVNLSETAAEIANIGQQLYGFNVYAGISRQHQGLDKLPEAVFEALYALHQNFYSEQSVCYYTLRNDRLEQDIHLICARELFTLEKHLNERKFETVRQNMGAIFSALKTLMAPEFDVKTVCMQIYNICTSVLLKNGLSGYPLHRNTDTDFYLCIRESRTINSLENAVLGLLTKTIEILSGEGKSVGIPVKKALKYIYDNYQKDLSLELIANECYINSSYLSRIFKKAMNEPISEYINKIRIEKAKELLTISALFSYEVAEAVGFNDPAYFSKVFKKMTGSSPKNFKSMSS